ncbi:MAG: SGNH/GDSL hydrolase family protein [Verrucomicrobiia bacterium]
MKPVAAVSLAFLLGVSCMAAEPVFDVRFDHLKGSGLPAGWSYYGSGTHMQLKDGNLVFTNEEPKRESGIVSRIEVEKGFDYEFTVELAEGHPGEKVEGVFLLLTAADGQAGRVIVKTPVVSGNLGQYVSTSMRYSPPDTGKVALYLHSRQGFTPRAKIRRILCQRSADQRTWLPANQPPFTVCGLPFMKENKGAYYRYPEARAKHLATWSASCQPSGARIRFKTNADKIELLINHGKSSFPWPEMSALSMAGIDIYQGPPNQMVFAWRPDRGLINKDSPYIGTYIPTGDPGTMREYTLYLPMYARLASLDIALSPASAKVEPPTPYKLDKPVVWYSTSFAQGAGASGPSMSFPALTCRLLGLDLVNYGISGNREWKPEEAEMLSEIPAAVYVMGPLLGDVSTMEERYPKMVGILRKRHPATPILLVTRLHTLGTAKPHDVNAIVRKLYEKQLADGDKNIHFLDAFTLYSDGAIPYTIDGVHVTDLGSKTIADAFVPALKRILKLP